MAVNGFWERIERMGNGWLSADFGNGLSGFGERIERMGNGLGRWIVIATLNRHRLLGARRVGYLRRDKKGVTLGGKVTKRKAELLTRSRKERPNCSRLREAAKVPLSWLKSIAGYSNPAFLVNTSAKMCGA